MGKKYITPEGTRDLVLGECAIKKKLQMDIEEILDMWGYKEVVTPTIEFYETFNSGFQRLKEEEVYKFFDNKGKILVLRPDMTIPIARVVATKFKDVPAPIRFRYSSNVYRVNESLGGKKNEYTDCGVELIGTEDKLSDLEILVTALDVLKALEVSDYKLEVGNINFFNSLIKDLNLEDEDRIKLAGLIDRKSLKELDEYLEYLKIEDDYKEFFKKIPWLFGGKEVLEKGKRYCFNEEIRNSIDYLEKLSDVLDELGYGDLVTYDLGMVPRLDYYTGIIFRGYVGGVGATVLSGGRYDNLISYFGEERKAVGFSINLDSVMDIMKDKKIEQKKAYKLFYGKKSQIEAFKKAEELRKQGFIVNMICDFGEDGIKVQEAGNNR